MDEIKLSNMAEARIAALESIIGFLDVSLESGQGDLWIDIEDLPDPQQQRFAKAANEVIDSLRRRLAKLQSR